MDIDGAVQFGEILESDDDCVLLVVNDEQDSLNNEEILLPNEFLDASISAFTNILEDLVIMDPDTERSTRVKENVLRAISCYQDILDKRFKEKTPSNQSASSDVLKIPSGKSPEIVVASQVRYSCKDCGVSFTSPTYLGRHQKMCESRKTSTLSPSLQPLYCLQCNRSFSTPYNHNRHMVTHIIDNKHFPYSKRLKMVDIKQEDIENAAELLKSTNINVKMSKIAKENDVSTSQAIDVNYNEEGEIPVRNSSELVNKKTKYYVDIVDNESGSEFTEELTQSEQSAGADEDNYEDITMVNNGKIYKVLMEDDEECGTNYNNLKNNEDLSSDDKISNINEPSDIEKSIEKHKLDIISDHVLQKRKKYWSAFELTCVSCGEMFVSPDDCETHVQEKHEDEKPFICNHCDSCFTNITQLRKHTFAKHKVIADENNVYLKKFGSLKHLGGFSKQISIKVYSCRVCHVKFSRADTLKSHERRHLGIVKTSKDGDLMLSKQKVHKSTKPPSLSRISCSVCGGSYSTRANLKKHMAVHYGEPKYSCQHCGKTFLKSDCLTYHLRTHTKERPWRCSICSENFSDRRTWLVHLNNHKGLRPYKCEACTMSFVDRRHLNKHVFLVHGNNFKPKPVFQIVVEDGDSKQNPLRLLSE